MKRSSLSIRNTCIKQFCSHKVRDFAMAFRVRTLFGKFEKRAPDEKWQLVIFSHGMFVALMFLFRILILLLVNNTMDNVSKSGLNTTHCYNL